MNSKNFPQKSPINYSNFLKNHQLAFPYYDCLDRLVQMRLTGFVLGYNCLGCYLLDEIKGAMNFLQLRLHCFDQEENLDNR